MMELLKTNDLRDVHNEIRHWTYLQDFTLHEEVLCDPKRFYKAFVVSVFLDLNRPLYSISELSELGADFDENTKNTIKFWWRKLGLTK